MTRSTTYKDAEPDETEAITRIAEKQEDTRTRIAQFFVVGYLALIFTLIIFSTFFKLPAEGVKDYLLAISSPLGFIIGFYFKANQQ